MVEQLAQEYAAAGSPVVFIEEAKLGSPGNRYGRFKTAFDILYPGLAMHTPWVMVESGNQISYDYVSFRNVYKAMVDAELARPAQGEVSASYAQVVNHIEADVTVANQSGITLTFTDHSLSVGVLVYEDFDTLDYTYRFTKRWMRAAGAISVSSLANGATKTYHVSTDDLPAGTNFDRLHVIGYAEYRPQGTAGPFDMLQAAAAAKGNFLNVTPSNLTLTVSQLTPAFQPVDMTAPVVISGAPANTNWQVTSSTSGFSLSPSSGAVNTQVQLLVNGSALNHGTNTGTINISAVGDSSRTATLTVKVNYPTPSLTVTPNTLANLLNNQELTGTKVATIQVTGNLTGLPWTVDTATTPTWVSLTPSSGVVGASAVSVDVYVDPMQLNGWKNSGAIRLKASTSKTTTNKDVSISYDPPDPAFVVQPDSLIYFADPLDRKDHSETLQVTGSTGNLWWSDWTATATSDADWLTVTPSGKVGVPATLTINASKLHTGQNIGVINFSATKYLKPFTKSVEVTVFLQQSQKIFLPVILRGR